jgi:hypothetical protein
MANTSTNLLSATITATDASNNVPINRGIGNPSWLGSLGQFTLNYVIVTPALDTALTLPVNAYQVYIKNLAAPGGSIVTVKWTPTGGASATVLALQPGSCIIFWEVTNAGGITALLVNASLANTPIEYFIGA